MLDRSKIFDLIESLLLKYPNIQWPTKPVLLISNSMRTTAGTANYKFNTIKLNNRLLSKNLDHLEQTVAHELAHLIAVQLHGLKASGHGHAWQNVMRTLGYSPDRTHKLDCTGLQRKHTIKGHVICKCMIHALKSKRYNRIVMGAKFVCLKCKGPLVLK